MEDSLRVFEVSVVVTVVDILPLRRLVRYGFYPFTLSDANESRLKRVNAVCNWPELCNDTRLSNIYSRTPL